MSKKEIDVGYSPESISEMREFFKNNDFMRHILRSFPITTGRKTATQRRSTEGF